METFFKYFFLFLHQSVVGDDGISHTGNYGVTRTTMITIRWPDHQTHAHISVRCSYILCWWNLSDIIL